MENVQLVQFTIIGVAVFVVLWLIADYIISAGRKKKQQVAKKAFHTEQEQQSRFVPKSERTTRNPAHGEQQSQSNAHPTVPDLSEQKRAKHQAKKTQNKTSITDASSPHIAKRPSTVDLQNIGQSSSAEQTKRPVTNPMSTARQAVARTKKDLKEALPHDYNTEDLVVVFVKAPEREFFAGNKIQAFFTKYDIRPGHKKIFHRHQQDDTGAWRLVFSVANGVGDGTLMESNLPEVRTRSLVFITWTRAHKPLRYFDDMIYTANQLAHELGGRLYAANKELWTEQTTNKTREFIREKLTQLHKERAAPRHTATQ